MNKQKNGLVACHSAKLCCMLFCPYFYRMAAGRANIFQDYCDWSG